MTGESLLHRDPDPAPARPRQAVVLCTDRNMLVPALFVADAVRRLSPGRVFDLIIVTDAEAATDTDRRWMAAHGILHEIRDFAPLRPVIALHGRLTTATLVKLTLAQTYAGRYDRILYLDTDLTIHGDVTGLLDLDYEGAPLAAERRAVVWVREQDRAKGEQHLQALGMTAPYRFFNSGVLGIDVAAWNRADLTDRTLAFIGQNPELCPLPDEHGLNAILDGGFAPISPIWNMAPRRLWMMGLHRHVAPVIVHYSGPDKPWRRFGDEKPLFPDGQAHALYAAFLRGTPWEGFLRQQWSGRDLRLSLKFDLRRLRRSLTGRSRDLTADEVRRYIDGFRDHCTSDRFIDVEQGLAVRSDGILRLNPAWHRR